MGALTAAALTLVALTGLLASMVFFAALVTPTVFRSLDHTAASKYLRSLFPLYYLWCLAWTAAAVLGAWLLGPWMAATVAVILILFAVARWWLLPAIDRAREAHLAGDVVASARFKRLHLYSVVLNLGQMIAAAVLIARLLIAHV